MRKRGVIMARVKSGIPGFDGLIDGGFPENSVTLVSGTPGSGKSIFALHFIAEGAKKNEAGVYITFEQTKDDLIRHAKAAGIDLTVLEKKGLFRIISMWPKSFDDIFTKLTEIIKLKPRRLVVDSITSGFLDHEENRGVIHEIFKKMKEMGLTSVLTSELVHGQQGFSRDGVSEFVADGLVILEAECVGEDLQRTVRVVKMRETKIDGGRHEVFITENGMTVK